jgi:hypothetical protein
MVFQVISIIVKLSGRDLNLAFPKRFYTSNEKEAEELFGKIYSAISPKVEFGGYDCYIPAYSRNTRQVEVIVQVPENWQGEALELARHTRDTVLTMLWQHPNEVINSTWDCRVTVISHQLLSVIG